MLKTLAFVLTLFSPTINMAAGEPSNVLDNGDFSQAVSSWNVPTDQATAYIVNTRVGSFRKALHITIGSQARDNPWSITLGQPVQAGSQKIEQEFQLAPGGTGEVVIRLK